MHSAIEKVSRSTSFTSVVVCTRNRPVPLGRCLRSLASQSMPPDRFEVIVVDDGCRDGARRVCEQMTAGMPNLRYVRNSTPHGLASARNAGIRQAAGEQILFTDDDCVTDERWVEKLGAALGEHPIVAGAVSTPTDTYWRLCHNVAQFHEFMPGLPPRPVTLLAGANMGFRRGVLEALGCFSPVAVQGDDMEIALRARQKGFGVWFTPEAVVWHLPDRNSCGQMLRYAAAHASGTIGLRHRYRSVLWLPCVFRTRLGLLLSSPASALWVTLKAFARNHALWSLFWTAPMVFAAKLAWSVGAARGLAAMNGDGS